MRSRKSITGILSSLLIASMLLAGFAGCAHKKVVVVRTSLKVPSQFKTDHHVIVAQQNVMVTVGDIVVPDFDAGGQYIIHPNDFDAVLSELDDLEAKLKEARKPNQLE